MSLGTFIFLCGGNDPGQALGDVLDAGIVTDEKTRDGGTGVHPTHCGVVFPPDVLLWRPLLSSIRPLLPPYSADDGMNDAAVLECSIRTGPDKVKRNGPQVNWLSWIMRGEGPADRAYALTVNPTLAISWDAAFTWSTQQIASGDAYNIPELFGDLAGLGKPNPHSFVCSEFMWDMVNIGLGLLAGEGFGKSPQELLSRLIGDKPLFVACEQFFGETAPLAGFVGVAK